MCVAEHHRVESVVADGVYEFAGAFQNFAVGGAQRVPAVVELEHDERVESPRDVLVAADLVFHEVAERAPVDVVEVDLRVHGEVDDEQVGGLARLVEPAQVIAAAAQVAPVRGLDRHPAVRLRLQLQRLVLPDLLCGCRHLAVRVDGEVAPEVAFERHLVLTHALHGPDLLLLHGGAVCSHLVLERFGREVFVGRVSEPEGPLERLIDATGDRHCCFRLLLEFAFARGRKKKRDANAHCTHFAKGSRLAKGGCVTKSAP